MGTIAMKRFVFSAFAVLAAASCARPAPPDITDAWARDTVGGKATAAVFMTIRSTTPDRLIDASAAIADKSDLMTMSSDGATMQMKYVKQIEIPANVPFKLNAAGPHIWLSGLRGPLKAGQKFPLFLTFENAGQRQLVVSVIKAAGPPPRSSEMRM